MIFVFVVYSLIGLFLYDSLLGSLSKRRKDNGNRKSNKK